jgi:selenocysteine-specific translation elongation factor
MDLNQFVIDDSFSIFGKGTVFVGRVVAGTLKAGMKCANFTDREVVIKALETKWGQGMESVSAGQTAGLILEGLEVAERGTILNFI